MSRRRQHLKGQLAGDLRAATRRMMPSERCLESSLRYTAARWRSVPSSTDPLQHDRDRNHLGRFTWSEPKTGLRRAGPDVGRRNRKPMAASLEIGTREYPTNGCAEEVGSARHLNKE